MTGALGCVVLLHAHPDDEAIFTGGTAVLLARAGWRVVLVLATQGEQGEVPPWVGPDVRLGPRRVAETGRAAELLGIARVEFLGYHDSGMAGAASNAAPGAFAAADTAEAVERLSRVLAEERPDAVVTYDAGGIYGHPDHVKAHEVGVAAAAGKGIPTVYEATVDREYLHFVETHLVVEAGRAGGPQGEPGTLGLAASGLGVPTVMVAATVDVRSVLAVKRAAMAAHASQIPETSSALRLGDDHFGAVYGFEWYGRRGPRGPLEALQPPGPPGPGLSR